MTENWIIQDIESQIAKRERVVVLDPTGEGSFLLPIIEKNNYTVLKTDNSNVEEWQRVKEELLLRYRAETILQNEKIVFYVTRPQQELSFLFDYCFTHGCVDLSNPSEWVRQKLFKNTGHQITMDNSMLLTAAKMGIGKDLSWWKKILQSLEELVSIEEELIPFLNDPEIYFSEKEPDVRRLFEEKIFELISQSFRVTPAQTLATEVVNHLFSGLLNNVIKPELLSIYLKWLDSNSYSQSLKNYISGFKLPTQQNIWNVHPEHCFIAIDKQQLVQITANFRDKSFVKDKLEKIKLRIKNSKSSNVIPLWWQDVINIFEFDSKPLANCNSLAKVVEFYTTSFHKIDRSIRNIYTSFLQETNIVRPLQEHYESLNRELLQHWFDYNKEYNSNQQGFLPQIISQAKQGTAIIVGDGLRYEIAAYIAAQLDGKCKVETNTMLADMPSETEHNMTALYVGNDEVLSIHKDREKRLTEATGKDITYLNLEALHYGIKADYLILTYKDIDSSGEKLQLGAIKLFNEFENILMEKILLLLNMGYEKVYLITDHGFVLTGILDEADKIDPNAIGRKEVHERFIRTVEDQNLSDWIKFNKSYGDFNYVYAAKNDKPFKSKGVYGFSHGGFTPQEIIIPNFVFSKIRKVTSGIEVEIVNKKELTEVTGEVFGLKVQAIGKIDDLFSSNRKVQILLYANNITFSSSNIINIEPGPIQSFEFSFGGNNEIIAVIVDANTQEQIDSVKIKKSNARDLGGLL